MTKRFTYIKNNSITQYQSLPIQEIGKGKALHCQGVVDKLNKLSDENEQLKSKNKGLESELQIFKEDVTHSNLQINKLADENEQLKQDKTNLHRAMSRDRVRYLNENEKLKKENQELRQDNDIKFWKHQFMTQHNSTQLILHELSLAMNEGYEVSDKFKEWLDDLTEKNKEVITKHERLFE